METNLGPLAGAADALTTELSFQSLNHMVFRQDRKTGKIMRTWEGKEPFTLVLVKASSESQDFSRAVKASGSEAVAFLPYTDTLC